MIGRLWRETKISLLLCVAVWAGEQALNAWRFRRG